MEPAEDRRDALIDQAIDWLLRLESGQASQADFDFWREADPRHAAAFAQVALLWQRTGELRGAGLAGRFGGDPAPPARRVDDAQPAAPHGGISRRRALGALAAGLAGIAALGGYAWSTRRSYAATAVGERRVLQLVKGTSATLNTTSRLSWRAGADLHLWLEQGELAIVVGGIPLLVEAGRLLGRLGPGRYNLRQTGVGVAELVAFSGGGTVRAGDEPQARAVSAGQMVRLDRDRLETIQLGAARLEALSAWQRGEVVFDGMTLPAALAEFNRYLTTPIRIGDPRLESLQLGGRFSVDDPSGFLVALHDGFGIVSRDAGDRIVLSLAKS